VNVDFICFKAELSKDASRARVEEELGEETFFFLLGDKAL